MNCLIVDDMHPSILPGLRDLGISVDYRPEINRKEILAIAAGYEGIVVRSKTRFDEELFAAATNLKFVARAGSGMDNIDEEAAKKRNVQLFNAPEGNRAAVAEHTIGLILALLNNIVPANDEVKNYLWDREGNRGRELGNQTVAIIGYGNTGRSVAKRLTGFGCKTITYDKYVKPGAEDFAGEVNMETLFTEADVVTLHVPLTTETRHLINEEFLSSFKKPVYLINTSRGEVVKTDDLLRSLEKGKVLGAGLDVLENEKFNTYSTEEKELFKALAARPNVILTPHVAGWTFESHERINAVLLQKIEAWLLTPANVN